MNCSHMLYEEAIQDKGLYANWLCDQKSPLELAYIVAYLRYPYGEKDVDWVTHCQEKYLSDAEKTEITAGPNRGLPEDVARLMDDYEIAIEMGDRIARESIADEIEQLGYSAYPLYLAGQNEIVE